MNRGNPKRVLITLGCVCLVLAFLPVFTDSRYFMHLVIMTCIEYHAGPLLLHALQYGTYNHGCGRLLGHRRLYVGTPGHESRSVVLDCSTPGGAHGCLCRLCRRYCHRTGPGRCLYHPDHGRQYDPRAGLRSLRVFRRLGRPPRHPRPQPDRSHHLHKQDRKLLSDLDFASREYPRVLRALYFPGRAGLERNSSERTACGDPQRGYLPLQARGRS